MKSMSKQPAITWSTRAATATAASLPADDITQSLIVRCLAGEESAYADLYNQYAAMIYRLNYSLLQHKEDAEEVLQDSFDYAFRKLHRYDPKKSAFKTWLYHIAISRCRNKRRRKRLPSFSLSQLAGQDIPDETVPTPDERLILDDQQKRVWNAVSALSPKLRETAVLRYYEGLSYGDIGQILGIPAKTAESRMRLAHRQLYGLLLDDPGTISTDQE
jgi:RNA polymerase sigma-70 factor (ECF subfamily)